jgi:23S rRNA pseudouridine955/2504/2580 synthase
MNFMQYTITQDDENRRIDRVLRKFLKKELTLSQIYKYLRNGQIKVNNKKTKPDYKTQKNDIIFINEKLIKSKNQENQNIQNEKSEKSKNDPKLEVIFENQYVKIINKPYNISVQKAQKDEIALDEIIKSQYQPTEKSLSFNPGPLHRLDKKTTGLLAFSNNLVGAQEFSNILQNHKITKTYITVLDGKLASPQKWQDKIATNEKNGKNDFKTVTVNGKSENSKEAITEVFPIKTGIFQNKEITLAKILIYTGRTHQIRSQCAFHGFPLLGDTAYNPKTSKISKNFDFFLHAYKLNIPKNNKISIPEEIIAPLPKNFLIFLKKYLSLEDFPL